MDLTSVFNALLWSLQIFTAVVILVDTLTVYRERQHERKNKHSILSSKETQKL
jgi:hypothetical protein